MRRPRAHTGPGAALPRQEGRLKLTGTDREPGGRQVHPPAISVGPEAEAEVREHEHRGDPLPAGTGKGEIPLEPAEPGEGAERPNPFPG